MRRTTQRHNATRRRSFDREHDGSKSEAGRRSDKKKSPVREMRDQRCLTVGGGRRIRTDGILLAKQTLYQLSYTPYARENAWWA